MRRPRGTAPALVVASVLGRSTGEVDAAVDAFSRQFGPLALVSQPLAFDWTGYYRDELGPAPVRRVLALRDLEPDPARLPTIKRTAGRLEVGLSRPGEPRAVNIDPGLLNESQLVLASTKPAGHRIYLGQGVHGELALIYRGEGGFEPLPWTYPDYGGACLRELAGRLRRLYLAAATRERHG